MHVPDWRKLVLTPGVHPEPIPEDNRIVLWVPGSATAGVQHWERISTAARPEITVDQGMGTTPATALRARQPLRGFLGRLWQRFRKATASAWTLPTGEAAEPWGERQTDLILVWADGATCPVDETRIKARWPQSKRLQKLADNLFLVGGVAPPGPATAVDQTLPQGCPRQQVEQAVAAARQRGDRPQEASALTDLGVITTREGDAPRAMPILEEALALARQLGDQSRELDALGNLGTAHLSAGQAPPALTHFGQELAEARAAGDGYAEKLALDHLGLAYWCLRDFPRAFAHYEAALLLARPLGDWQHEADLLGYLAILHAEQGQRQQALTRGQAAVDLFRKLGKPQARWLADHFHQYRLQETGLWPGGPGPAVPVLPPSAFLGEVFVAGGGATPSGSQPAPEPAASGPGLLRMAFSAVKSMAKFIGSGGKMVSAEAHQQRLQMCGACEHHTGVRCRLCGCFTSAKAWLPHEDCPLGKWPI